MAISDRRILHFHGRTPFVDSTELALILGEPHDTVHRGLTHLLANGIREATDAPGFNTPSEYVQAYSMSREWQTLLMRRMDAVASV